MEQEQNPRECKNFDIHVCPYHDEKLMKDYITKTTHIRDVKVDFTEGFSMAPKVYETFCHNCEKRNFKKD